MPPVRARDVAAIPQFGSKEARGIPHRAISFEACQLMAELTTQHLNAIEGKPRILDMTLAECLGFTRPRTIRQLIERNRSELERYGAVIAARYSDHQNRQFIEYWLSETQAILVCLFSRTERGAEVREAVITVFTSWRRAQRIAKAEHLTRVQLKAINSRAWALAMEEMRTSFQQHKTRLIQEARELLATGRPIDALLVDKTDHE